MGKPSKPRGDAPVNLHDLLHKLQTSMGVRPKPVAGRSEEMTAVPVQVSVCGRDADGNAVAVLCDPSGWALLDGPDRLVFYATVPERFAILDTLVAAEVPAAPAAPPPDVDLPNACDPIPELRHLDPGVFRANTDKPAGAGTRDRVPNSGDNSP